MATDAQSAKSDDLSIKDAEFLQECRENYRNDRDRDQIDRQEAEDDHVFVYSSDSTVRNNDGVGSQWSSTSWKQRKTFNRPIMQWNRMHIYQQYVVNQARQNDFAIRVSPSDNGTPETAEYFEGRIRQIEYESNAGTVYDIARENQCSSGRGFYRISTEFIPGSFNQRIKLDEIPDQFSVLFGPGKEYDRSDAERCWVILPPMTKAQYKRKFGKKALENAQSFIGEDGMDLWWNIGRNGDMIQVCELFIKEFKKKKLLLLADGTTTVPADGLELGDLPDAMFYIDPETEKPMEREEDTYEVWRYTIDGAQVLDKEQFAVDEIPIIPQWGLCSVVLGTQRAYSLGNRAKDAQRLVNLCVSNLAQAIGAQVKAKVMAEIEQIDVKAHGDDWAGKTDAAILFYSRFSQTLPGNPDLGVPQLIAQEAPIQALVEALQQAIEALKAAHGIYDASLGARGNETSGKAIDKRKEQAEIVNYHFLGNEARSRKRAGQILIKLISILDQPGMEKPVRDRAGETKTVQVTEALSDVDYGLNVDMGPTWKSQQQQVHDTDGELMKALPQEMAMALTPEFLRTQDAPNAKERADIATRVVNKIMPGILPEDEKQQPIPPQVQQQLMEMQQQLAQKDAFAQSLHEQIQTDQVKQDAENQRQERELQFKREELATKERIEMAKLGSKEDIVLLESNLAQIETQAGLQHDEAQTQAALEHESEEARATRDHQSGESEASREATATEAEKSRAAAAEQADLGRQHELTAAEMAAKQATKVKK